MSSPIYSSMRSGSLQRQRTILREKQKTKGKAQKRKTTKEHFAEQAALTRHKLKKRAVSQGGADPWIVGESYTLKIPEDQFEHTYTLDCMGRLFVTFEDANSSKASYAINIVIMLVLVISCVQYVIQSLPSVKYQPDSCLNPACDNDLDLCPGRVVCEPIPPDWFEILETICVIVFTADYILRVASCSFVPARISGVSPMALSSMDNPTDINDPEFEFIERYRDPEYEELWWVSIYRYVLQPLNIIDLVAVVPFYIELVFSSGSSLSIIRILRLARVIRLAKSGKGRFTKGLKILSNTLITSAPMNAFLLAVALIIFVVCGAIGFLIEGGEFKVSHEYPNGTYMRTDLLGEHLEPTPFISVLHGMYWSIVTSTTVGYGDMYTTTAGGRIFTCACTFLGIIVIAMPVTVLGTHFSKEYEKEYMVEEEQEAVRRQSVRRLSLAKMELSFMNDNGSMRPTLGMSGSQLTSHLSSIEGDISICPEVKHAEEAVTRLEALSNELQRSIAEIKFELATHKAVIRKATAAALIRMESSVSGVDDCVEEDSKNSNEFRQADTNHLSEDSTVNDMPLNEWKPKSMSVISQRYVEEAKL